MAKPKFTPTAEQKRTLAALRRYRERRDRSLEKLDEEARQLAITAYSQGIPVEQIAPQIKMDRRTVTNFVKSPELQASGS